MKRLNATTGEVVDIESGERGWVDTNIYASDIAAKRYEVETGGMVWNSYPVATDRQSQAILDAMQRKAEKDSSFTVGFKTGNGFVDLDAPQIIALGDAVFQFVQDCFAVEQQKLADLEAGNEVDLETGWPS